MKENTGFWKRNIRKRLIWILLKQDGHATDLSGLGVGQVVSISRIWA
jgi:hypothetical protein